MLENDAIMPQTKEAISHAQAAGVSMIFAINKIDNPDSNPEKIKEQLRNIGYSEKLDIEIISLQKILNV